MENDTEYSEDTKIINKNSESNQEELADKKFMTISAKEVQELRKISGAGMMECKTALSEANGDLDQAFKILRAKRNC